MQSTEPSVFRVNQTGYAAGLPVHVAVVKSGTVRLRDAQGHLIREQFPAPVPADAASGDCVTLLDLGSLPDDVVAAFIEAGKNKRITNLKSYMKAIIWTVLQDNGLRNMTDTSLNQC